MRILIQNRKTRLFLAEKERWTSKAPQAKNFESALHAFEYSRQHLTEDTEIVFQPTRHLANQILPRLAG